MNDSAALSLLLAHRVTATHVNSARPDAPVVVESRRRRREHRPADTTGPARAALAAWLRRAADAVAPECVPGATAR